MSNTPSLPRRVLSRALVGTWRQKKSLVLAGGVLAAMVGYLYVVPVSASVATTQVQTAPDCADAVIATVVGKDTPAVRQQVYDCLNPDLQQRVFQQGFGSQYRTLAAAAVGKVSRVGTHGTESGAELVYYAVEAGDQSVGYVVHLSPDGKVTDIS